MSKIFNDISKSNYFFKYDNLVFYFSSEFYLNKFKKEYVQFLNTETMKMKLKYKCNIYADEMILLLLYKKIEKRGFRVTYKDKLIVDNYFMNVSLDELI